MDSDSVTSWLGADGHSESGRRIVRIGNGGARRRGRAPPPPPGAYPQQNQGAAALPHGHLLLQGPHRWASM